MGNTGCNLNISELKQQGAACITVPESACDEAFFCFWEAFAMYSFRLGVDSSAVCPPSPCTCIYFPEPPRLNGRHRNGQSEQMYIMFKTPLCWEHDMFCLQTWEPMIPQGPGSHVTSIAVQTSRHFPVSNQLNGHVFRQWKKLENQGKTRGWD